MTTEQSYDTIIIHYGEIGTKKKNRIYFEQRLIRNIGEKIDVGGDAFFREVGLYGIQADKIEGLTHDQITDRLSKIPGIEVFSFAKRTTHEMESIIDTVLSSLPADPKRTFRISTQRHYKSFEKTSIDVDKEVGAAVCSRLGMSVSLRDADIDVKIEITDKAAYVSIKEFRGVGGLPTDSSQKVVSLLSGGIDSPVASYMLMKRGCAVTFVHFQNKNQMTAAVEDKIQRIAQHLAQYQQETQLIIVPFEDIQKKIIQHIGGDKRMIIYRKVMIEIAQKIAQDRGAHALVLGDSVSQVASQTLRNLASSYAQVMYPLLLPLIGLNKQEIVDIAVKIGTYDISILPYGDCCSYFLAKHPAVKSNPGEIADQLTDMDLDQLYEEVRSKSTRYNF